MKRTEAEGVYLRRTVDGFRFASDYDREMAERWGVGSLVRADIHKPRSGKHQRWYRAIIRTVWRHQDQFASPDALHKALQYRLGEYDLIYLRNGDAVIDFHSTSFSQMEEGAFRDHVNRAWEIIAQEIIPGLDEEGRRQLTKEIDRLMLGTMG